jgi:hypothetical protein
MSWFLLMMYIYSAQQFYSGRDETGVNRHRTAGGVMLRYFEAPSVCHRLRSIVNCSFLAISLESRLGSLNFSPDSSCFVKLIIAEDKKSLI